MAVGREIKRRIGSVKNVSQITRAMEMVSASKMRRAQRNVVASRPYADRILEVISNLSERVQGRSRAGTLLEGRESVSKVSLVVITPDRGLCGGLITNALRRSSRFVLNQRQQGREVEIYAIGKKGRNYFARTSQNLVGEVTGLSDAPAIEDILGIATNIVTGFRDHEIDEAYIVYSEFVNTLVQRAALKRLIPVETPEDTDADGPKLDYIYEPNQEELLDEILPRFVEVQIYQALLESIASEHSARMIAMRNATDNAKDLQRDLTRSYNRARQAGITKEVSEIASGAAALEGS